MIHDCVTLHLDDWKFKSHLLQRLLKNACYYVVIVLKQSLSFSFHMRESFRWTTSGVNVCSMRNSSVFTVFILV